MEQGINDSILKSSYGFSSTGECFFVQKWIELLFWGTIDSYQYRIRNGHCLLKETLRVLDQVKSGLISYHNLENIIQECHTELLKDLCFKKHNTPLWGSAVNCLKAPKSDDKAGLLRIEYQVHHILNLVDDARYLDWLILDLKEAIDKNELESINQLAEIFASEIINSGWSSRSLYRLKYFFLVKDSSPFNQRWDRFITEIKSTPQTFQCYFAYQNDSHQTESLLNTGITVVKGYDIVKEYPYSKEHVSEKQLYFNIPSNARPMDLISAVRYSRQSISVPHAINNYYGNGFSMGNSVLVITPDQKCISFDLISSWKQQSPIMPLNKEHIEGTIKILNNSGLELESKERLKNTFIQYKLGSESLSIENWFTSLWIALETLFVTGQYSSIIEHIKRFVPAILCSRYVYRVLKNFLDDCNRCKVVPIFSGIKINTITPTATDIENLLNIFRNESELKDFYNMCSDYSLLKLRCHNISSCLKDNASLKDFIEKHHENTSWHLQRLYRVRNELIHYSFTDLDLSPLSTHLNYYLRCTISEILYRLSSGKFKQIGELFCYLENNYEATVAILSDKKIPYDNSLILKGAISIS